MGSTNMSPQSRQQPGCACEQCRKRKLRCDRQRPRCGTCAEAGIACEVNNNRQARGPKKGDLKALRGRIVALERRLSHDLSGETLITNGHLDFTHSRNGQLSIDSTLDQDLNQLPSPYETTPGVWENEIHVQIPMTPKQLPSALPHFGFPPSPPPSPNRLLIDDLMRADLDMLYFDRVHPNIPIFNQSRYFARSRQVSQSAGPTHQLCLQYAMWTLAMALSSQFESYRDALYLETKQTLEVLEASEDDMGVVPIEHVQTWLLIAFYEFTRASFRRGWISAGRAFRLVQLANLHGIDGLDNMPRGDDAVLIEERRRTFWMAYCLDRFIGIQRGHWPLTLPEEAITTRLPSPELAFQSGHPIQVSFLSEALASNDHSFLSPLAESAILATICGRGLSHCQVSKVERAYGGPAPVDFWLRHEWLEGMLRRRLNSLGANYSVGSSTADPMMIFTLMMGQGAVIILARIALEAVGGGGGGGEGNFECDAVLGESRRRAVHAAGEIGELVKAHDRVGYFKAHIFLPSAISLGASCLQAAQHGDAIKTTGGEVGVLAEMSTVFHVTGAGAGARAGAGADAGVEAGGGTATGLRGGGDRAAARGYEPALRSCLDALRKMQSFNNLAREQVSLVEVGGFSVE